MEIEIFSYILRCDDEYVLIYVKKIIKNTKGCIDVCFTYPFLTYRVHFIVTKYRPKGVTN